MTGAWLIRDQNGTVTVEKRTLLGVYLPTANETHLVCRTCGLFAGTLYRFADGVERLAINGRRLIEAHLFCRDIDNDWLHSFGLAKVQDVLDIPTLV